MYAPIESEKRGGRRFRKLKRKEREQKVIGIETKSENIDEYLSDDVILYDPQN